MIIELGHFFLILSLVLALIVSLMPLIGYYSDNQALMKTAQPAAVCMFGLVAASFLTLVWAFVSHDFSVSYVAAHSNSQLPLMYRISGVWGAHEGSLLLWALSLSGWTAAVALLSSSISLRMRSLVLAVLAMIISGFLLFILLTSNPFSRILPPVGDGSDLNPLLQDPGLIIHPPLLYMGYVGFAVAFAFAIAALIEGKMDASWARAVRPWTNIAWLFLTLGIAIGSWWAYYELGWGGWWFWDPVENASFMPWLTGTALIHSLAVTEQRNSFKAWTVLLSVVTFSLSLLGTFLVRSGVITSVHAFASDPSRGVFILLLLFLAIGGSLLLYAFRVHTIVSKTGFQPVSRESALLMNNVLLVVTAASILLGTLYPLVLDVLGLDKLSVGAPYFNSIFIPLMAPLALLVGFGSLSRWQQDSVRRIMRHLGMPFVLSLVIGALLPLTCASWQPLAFFGSWLASWVVLSSLVVLINQKRHWRRIPASVYAMTLGHLGMAVFIMGITFTSIYSLDKNVSMVPGDSMKIAGLDIQFRGIQEYDEDNYQVREGLFDVRKGARIIDVPLPQKRFYPVQKNTTTEAGIASGFFYDIYLSLGEPIDEQTQRWSVRVYYKVLVNWIWLGALIMAAAALLESCSKRYRLANTQRES